MIADYSGGGVVLTWLWWLSSIEEAVELLPTWPRQTPSSNPGPRLADSTLVYYGLDGFVVALTCMSMFLGGVKECRDIVS